MKAVRRLLLGLAVVVLVAGIGFVSYASLVTAEPEAKALQALSTTAEVEVKPDEWLVFHPRRVLPGKGLILYPGGLVDPRAYAPFAREIAGAGFLVVIPPMPLNLAVFGANRASAVIEAYPEIHRWAVGGHSLGGAMASQYAVESEGAVVGLVLWAAYPPTNVDLSEQELAVVSIYGTRDGLSSLSEIETSRAQLPPEATFVAIEGGNHAQFGWYGPQRGDLPAMVPPDEQQAQVVAATVKLLEQMD